MFHSWDSVYCIFVSKMINIRLSEKNSTLSGKLIKCVLNYLLETKLESSPYELESSPL